MATLQPCFEEAAGRDCEKLKWGQTGPVLLSKAVAQFERESDVADPQVFCPINWWNIELIFDPSSDRDLLSGSHAVHLFNNGWRNRGIDKDGQFDQSSIYEKLKKRYLA